MAEKAKAAPLSPEDRQAVATVAATREVYGEIEKLAEFLKETWRPLAARVDAKHALAQASERLCNLMALAIYQMENHPAGSLRDKLTAELGELRQKLMSMSARLMVQKLEKIDERAQTVLKDQDYPIGLAGKLDGAFGSVMANLTMLGGAENLGGKVPELIAKTEGNIKSLAEIEKKIGAMKDVKTPPSRRK